MMMTFTQAVGSALSSYATFHGRARRSEYWWFYLFTILVAIPAGVIDAILDMAFNNEIGIVGTITSLALLLPTLAVTARRLHDTGRTGWWMLLPVVPLLAAFVVGIATVVSAVFSAGGDGATTGAADCAPGVLCAAHARRGHHRDRVPVLALEPRPEQVRSATRAATHAYARNGWLLPARRVRPAVRIPAAVSEPGLLATPVVMR